MKIEKPTIEQEFNRIYESQLKAQRVALLLTPLQIEHLHNLVDIGMDKRKRDILTATRRKVSKRMNNFEKHLLYMDKQILTKIAVAEELSFNEKNGKSEGENPSDWQ
jgi:hypothetical protein